MGNLEKLVYKAQSNPDISKKELDKRFNSVNNLKTQKDVLIERINDTLHSSSSSHNRTY